MDARNSSMTRRWQRRSALRVGALGAVGLTASWALACGGGDKQSPSAAPQAAGQSAGPKRGGSLTISQNFDRGFDPHIIPASTGGTFGLFYQSLLSPNPRTWEIQPELAEKWEVVSPTEIVFTLAPNVKWHDKAPVNGRALKISDVTYSYDRVRTEDPKFIHRSLLSNVDKITGVDDRTLRVTLKQPDVTSLGAFAGLSLKILAPEAVERADKTDKFAGADNVVGTGAFMLKENTVDVGAQAVRNPNYWKAGKPYLDRIDLKAFSDPQAEWAAFLSGNLHIRYVPGAEAKKFLAEKKEQFTLDWYGELGFQIAMPNVTRKPLDDARVTRALRLLIDHEEFRTAWAEVWYGRGRSSSIFAAASETWDLTEDEYSKLLEWKKPKDDAAREALSLLAAAGFTRERPLKFVLAALNKEDVVPSAQLLQAQWKRLSGGAVDVELKLHESAVWNSVRSKGEFEYYTAGHNVGGTDPDLWLSNNHRTGGSRNYGKMSDPKLDAMIDRQRTLFDLAERKKAIREIVLYMIDTSPYASLTSYYVLNANRPELHGFIPEGDTQKMGHNYENLWRER